MRVRDLAPFLPLAFVVFAPLACSSSASDDSTAFTDDGGGTTDDGDTTGDDGGTTGSDGSTGPFTPGPHPSYPQVPNNGGGVIGNPRIVAIIPANEGTSGLDGFAAAFMTSNTWKAVASEYGLGTAATPKTIPGASISGSQSQGTLETYIRSTVNGTSGADPDGHTIYLVFLPTTANLDSDPGCNQTGIGGYHTVFSGSDTFASSSVWGVVQHCSASVRGAITEEQWATIAASHEIVEAATDPVPIPGNQGYAFPDPNSGGTPPQFNIWDDVLLTEIGDLCVETQITEGSYTYQRMWSNKAAKSAMDPCVPAITPFFNTGTVGGDSNGWFQTSSGKAAIPLEGFSNAELPEWVIVVQLGKSSSPGWAATLTTPTTKASQRYIGNNEKGMLNVTAPSGASSGDWAIFELASYSADAKTPENVHIFPVGVVVP